jgi:peptidoglycan/xylan/chitin deacetylase (PgdA/CDA1 family)
MRAVLRRFRSKIHGYYQRKAASFLFKRPFEISLDRPVISFTFDDFPRSALLTGGDILSRFGFAGSYYVSLGLMGRQEPSGQMFVIDDLAMVLERGHELGCHTFSHCHSWETDTETFEDSIAKNCEALNRLLPEAEFRTFSYPISPPRPLTKAKIGKRFECCRGGGQILNSGVVDLNQLSAYFLEKSRHDIQGVKYLVDDNRRVGGWLIFATHDIAERPTPYGCTPQFFEEIVHYSLRSGALIMPVIKALEAIGAASLARAPSAADLPV